MGKLRVHVRSVSRTEMEMGVVAVFPKMITVTTVFSLSHLVIAIFPVRIQLRRLVHRIMTIFPMRVRSRREMGRLRRRFWPIGHSPNRTGTMRVQNNRRFASIFYDRRRLSEHRPATMFIVGTGQGSSIFPIIFQVGASIEASDRLIRTE